jgi:uncharacterized protein YgbK (DUF1537 family)
MDLKHYYEDRDDERRKVVNAAESRLRRGLSVLLAISNGNQFLSGSIPFHETNEYFSFLAEIVWDILAEVKIGGICVTGGDCAVRVMQKVKADNIRLEQEIQEGITLVRFHGGPYEGLPMITKAGPFGGERALIHAVEHLLSKRP